MVIKKKKPVKTKKAVRKAPLKRKKAKPVLKKKVAAKPKKSSNETLIGKVTHYFGHVDAAVIKLTKDKISQGDKLHIKGHSTDFTLTADSIQIDRVPVQGAKKGEEIGLKVTSRVRENDAVFKVKA